ncbi:hypothetical protein AWH63_06780 [Marinobacter sp. C18]|uniref:hypothetical protein n=1 Tax=Marinobacter sp. C18 TaxID=1772288 RepID=UPI000948C741|nr:hypothetical protein [Marinobacter sp. C18]OLF82704.1 hypothetical protein AWH63_06780 [Marinobacter sp. C18]
MKYRPSNGTEGGIFESRWCHNCAHDNYDIEAGTGENCDILMRVMLHGVDDPEYPEEWQEEPGEAPKCTAFLSRDDGPVKPRCPNTIDLFEDGSGTV